MLWSMILAMIASMDNHYQQHAPAMAENGLDSSQRPSIPLTQ